jgi:hypothetical protein
VHKEKKGYSGARGQQEKQNFAHCSLGGGKTGIPRSERAADEKENEGGSRFPYDQCGLDKNLPKK